MPRRLLARSAADILAEFPRLPADVKHQIRERVDYCNRLTSPVTLSGDLGNVRLSSWQQFNKGRHSSVSYYDLAALLRYFPVDQGFAYAFGDVSWLLDHPAFTKSRPIGDNNQNSVILKLDSIRHFYTYPDPHSFSAKLDKLVWRGAAHQPWRLEFLQKFHDHPLCDVGCVHKKSAGQPYRKGYLNIEQQLRYKYILSIEGNDVATNTKWIMASNSLCFMTRPKFETWLMEGRLKAEVHYVRLEDDYSDLDEKLAFYRQHPDAAERIIRNANAYMQPFFNHRQELITSLMVMKKYFDLVSLA